LVAFENHKHYVGGSGKGGDSATMENPTQDAGPAPDGSPAPFLHPSLACFVLLAKFLGVPADPSQIEHDRGKGAEPYSLEDLTRIAKKLGLVARLRTSAIGDLRKLPLPALAEIENGDAVILLRIEDDAVSPRFLVQRGDAEKPEVWSGEEMERHFAGRLLLVTSREAIAGDKRKFDISWFIPALVKYRLPLRDVLVGSFFLQLTTNKNYQPSCMPICQIDSYDHFKTSFWRLWTRIMHPFSETVLMTVDLFFHKVMTV